MPSLWYWKVFYQVLYNAEGWRSNGNVRVNNSEKQPLVRLHAMRAMGMFVWQDLMMA